MADVAAPPAPPVPPPHRPWRGVARVLSAVVLAVLVLAALLYGAVRWLDTDAGHRFLVRQAPLYKPQSGLTVRLERIDGSIFGAATLTGLRIGDPKGDLAVVPVARLDWRPFDLISNSLTIRSLVAPEVRLLRRPALRPSASERVLPDIDIVIGRLTIDRLVVEAPVTAPSGGGARRVLGLAARADIRAGRALIDLAALTIAAPGESALGAATGAGGGDTVKVMLDSEPDRDRFDVEARVKGPKDGAIAALIGIPHAVDLTVTGDGSWTVWRGRVAATLDGAPLADAAVTAREGLFSLAGDLRPAPLLSGATARLLGPVLKLDGTARMAERRVTLAIAATSPALVASARGVADFGEERFRDLALTARLRQPGAVYPKLRAENLRLDARLAGSFARPLADWRLTATRAGWGDTIAVGVEAAGIAQLGAPLPVRLRIDRVIGVGDTAAPLLTNVRVDGPVTLVDGGLVAERLTLATDRLRGTASARVVGGETRIALAGDLPGYTLAGVGAADVNARVLIVSDARGVTVTGPVRLAVRRLDNDAARRFLGGLPLITGDIALAPDLSLLIRNARIAAPDLTATLQGRRAANGVLDISATGTSRAYGGFSLGVTGQPGAPTIDLALARPGLSLGLADVKARVVPLDGAWSFSVSGRSSYGPVAANGRVRTQGPLTVDLAALTLAGVTGSGTLTQTAAGPFAGDLRFAGRGLNGTATLSAVNAVQRADITAAARDASLDLEPPVAIGSGQLKLVVLLPDAGPEARGSFTLAGVERDGTSITSASGDIAYAGGRGTISAKLAGQSGVPFTLATTANLTPEQVTITAEGSLDGRPIGTSGPAVLTRSATGWTLAPVTITTGEGSAQVSGRFNGSSEVHARLDRLSLSLLGIAAPTLDFSGRLSGTLDLALGADGVPSGSANLRVASLARAGIASSSLPIDVGLNAALGRAGILARAVIVRGDRVLGRAQARVGPVPPGDAPIGQRLLKAPVTGTIRYAGPAQAVWGLSGLEALDVRGPLAVDVALGGVVEDPQLNGRLATRGARAELAILGAVVDQVALDGRFTGARLELTRFAGRVGNDGSISGTGGIDLSAARAFPMDVRLQLKNAQLLKRDEGTGTATGNVRIATDEFGGVVSGRLTIDRARYQLGRTAAAEVPVLPVTEVNTQLLGRRQTRYAAPTRWLLDLRIKGDRRLNTSGLGLEAEWQADVRVKGGVTTPEIFGRVQLVRGDYDFAGKRFTLTKGDLRFQGGYPPDPLIDISATTTQNGFTAQLDIDGTALKPLIAFSSTPALPEDEVLSRVLFGSSVTDLSAPEAVQLAAALASLRGGGGGFNPVGLVRKGLGIDRLRILPADTTKGRKTAVAAGQYIGRSVYVELATDASGYTATNIEVSLTRSLSILSELATLGGQSVNLRWKRDY